MGIGTTLQLPQLDATNIQSGTVSLPDGAFLDVLSGTATLASGVTLIKDGAFGPSGLERELER